MGTGPVLVLGHATGLRWETKTGPKQLLDVICSSLTYSPEGAGPWGTLLRRGDV